jgi:hypothetical protein
MLNKIRLSQGPLDSRLALIRGFHPRVWFRFIDANGIEQRAAYRPSESNSTEYVFDTAESATGGAPPAA